MFSTIKAPHPIHKIHENGALIKCVGVGWGGIGEEGGGVFKLGT